MHKPITPQQMSEWIVKTWQECQDRAWDEKPAAAKLAKQPESDPCAECDCMYPCSQARNETRRSENERRGM